MLGFVVNVVVSLALILVASAHSLAQSAEDAIVIVEGRTGVDTPGLESSGGQESAESRWATSSPVLQAIAAARSYWSAEDSGFEEDLRVLDYASGSFTRSGAEQHAVLFKMSDQPRSFPPMGLAIVEGDRLVRNIAFVTIAQSIRALPDIDADGQDELALHGAFVGQGMISRGVTLAEFGDEGLDDFASAITLESACNSDYRHYGASAARLSIVPGSEITVEHFRQESCDTETWEPVGEPEPLQPIPDSQKTDYIEIPLGDSATD